MNKKNRPFFYALLILIVAAIVFYPKLRPLFSTLSDEPENVPQAGPRAINVDAQVLEPQRLVEVINSSGTLIPDEQVDLAFETSGKIVAINFDEGSEVKKGQLLAKINDRPLQAQLMKLEAQIKLAQEREFRQRSLLSSDAVSQESYDQALTELQSIEADIELLKARIAETELRAPFDGIIGLRYVSEGSFSTTNTRIASLVKVEPLKIEFSIPERYAGSVNPGFPINFSLDGVSDTLRAEIYAVDPRVDERTRNVTVRALYGNIDGYITPGRFVSIQLELSEINDAIAIPTEALIPEMEGDRVYLYRQGQADAVMVQTGLRTEDQIQITEGLQPGDTLVTTGILQMRQGIPISIDNLL